jgi:hypothetical protein
MDNKIFEMIRAVPPIEILFVFLPYYIRPLWPTTRIRTALENAKNKSEKNRLFQFSMADILQICFWFMSWIRI